MSVEDDGARPVSPDLVAAQRRAADALARLGARVEVARVGGLAQALEIWAARVDAGSIGGPSFRDVLEMPVTQVPLGLNAEGVPLGVQVAALRGLDHRTIAVAQRLEDALGGWVAPPSLQG